MSGHTEDDGSTVDVGAIPEPVTIANGMGALALGGVFKPRNEESP